MKVGVIGFVPPQVAHWDETHVAGRLEITRHRQGGARGSRRAAPGRRPRRRSLPFGDLPAAVQSRTKRTPPWTSRRSTGSTRFSSGHQHQLFPARISPDVDELDAARGTIGGKPAVMARRLRAAHLGVIDLALRTAAAAGASRARRSEVRPIANGTKTASPSRSSPPACRAPSGAGSAPAHARLHPRAGRRPCRGRSTAISR